MSRLARLLVALLCGTLVLSGCQFEGAYDLPLPGGNSLDEDEGYDVTADFRDVLSVVPRSPVMVSDVPVGQVLDVNRIGWHARVVMRVRNDIRLPDNAFADVRQTSLLGEKYVALVKPTGEEPSGRLGEGDHIRLDHTGRNPEVEEVLGALSFLLSGGGIGQLQTITAELNKMMDGRTGRLRHVLGQVDLLVGALDEQKADLVAAMEAIDSLSATLVRERKSVGAALEAMPQAIRVLNQQHRDLMEMLHQLDRLGRVGTRVMNASKDNLVATLRHLGPALKGLADAGRQLPQGLSTLISFPFPKEAASIVKGDYANALFNAKIDLSTLKPDGGGPTGLPTGLPTELPTKLPTQVPSVVVHYCKQVRAMVRQSATQAVNQLPLSKAQKRRLRDRIVRRVMSDIDCKHPGNIGLNVLRGLKRLLRQGIPGLPTALPQPSLPVNTSLLGGLPRPAALPAGRTPWFADTGENADSGGGLLGGGLG